MDVIVPHGWHRQLPLKAAFTDSERGEYVLTDLCDIYPHYEEGCFLYNIASLKLNYCVKH